jgi:type III secretory pathway lipoprotein EscJ
VFAISGKLGELHDVRTEIKKLLEKAIDGVNYEKSLREEKVSSRNQQL